MGRLSRSRIGKGGGARCVRGGGIEIGLSEKFFVFLDGGYLVQRLLGVLDHFQLPTGREYTNLGCMRITVERLKEPA